MGTSKKATDENAIRIVFECCCGLDIHKKMIVACLLRRQVNGQFKKETRTFSTMTASLLDLLDWLKSARCTHVAMESTGVYWKPIYNVLEGEMEVLLVNAQHIKAVPGRKTDVKDAEWIASLLQHGLLQASFVPPRPQRELRELTRTRKKLTEERSRIVNRIQKVLEDANIKLSSVVTDITGKTARLILNAMLAGEQDPQRLAGMAGGTLRKKQEELAQAVRGTLRENHQFLLNQHLAHLDFLDKQIKAFDLQIAQVLGLGPEEPDPSAREEDRLTEEGEPETLTGEEGEQHVTPAAQAESSVDKRSKESQLQESREPGMSPEQSPPALQPDPQRLIEQLDAIPGINQRIAEVIVAEIGLDLDRFATAEHLASWVGLCPGNAVSAGKRLSGKTTKGNRWLRTALIEAAHGATRSKGTFLGAYYQRLRTRMKQKQAIVALAHRILIIVYHVLHDDQPFRELGEQFSTDKERETSKRRAIHRLQQLGYEVQLQEAAVA